MDAAMKHECPGCGIPLDQKQFNRRPAIPGYWEVISPKVALSCPNCGIELEVNEHRLEAGLPVLINLAGLAAAILAVMNQASSGALVLIMLMMLFGQMVGKVLIGRVLRESPRYREFLPESPSQRWMRYSASALVFVLVLGCIGITAAVILHLI